MSFQSTTDTVAERDLQRLKPQPILRKNIQEKQDKDQEAKLKQVNQKNESQIRLNADAASRTAAPVLWKLEVKDGEFKIKASPNTVDIDFTTVSTNEEEIPAPKIVSIFGFKIDLSSKLEKYIDEYLKNYSLSRTHNLLVAKFAEFKVSYLGYLLSLLGISQEEIQKLQKKAVASSLTQNKALIEENEYNNELIAIIGGPKKQLRAQQRIMSELRRQLITNCERLGLQGYYTKEKIEEIQLEQCQKISLGFNEEKMNLEYQLNYVE
jgi:hypothetical protein